MFPYQSISDGFDKPKPGFHTILAVIDYSKTLLWHTVLFHKLASLFTLLIGFNIFFGTGMLAWFIKITIVAPFESNKGFFKDPSLAMLFFLDQ